jgi:hypothetical protein
MHCAEKVFDEIPKRKTPKGKGSDSEISNDMVAYS